MKTKEQIVEEILTRGVSEVIDRENLKKRLLSEEKLRVKFGIDPTSPNIHLGRAVSLLKLKSLQELGHRIVFIIGDFTGVIGDTSDKESERPMLDKKTVEKNLQTYFEQAGKILDMGKVEKHQNSEWLDKLTYSEIADQANVFSLAEFIARENIKKRLGKRMRISLRELLYPLMQGYDSVMVKADVEIGGTDQRFNLLAGRELQKHNRQSAQDVLMMNLIEGLDGRKMSSSWGNTINLTDAPNEMFGKIMSAGDGLIVKYFIHCTRVPMDEIKRLETEMKEGVLNPRDAKLQLAVEIVKIYHSEDEAEKAKEYFIKTISNKEVPAEVSEFKVEKGEIKILELLVNSGNAASMSDARRKVEQGGVSVDGEKILDPNLVVDSFFDNRVFKIGKLGWVKIKF